MNNNMTGFKWFSKTFAPLCYGDRSLSIGRINSCTKCLIDNCRLIVTQFPRHGCNEDDLATEHSFESHDAWVTDVLGLFFDILSMGVG